MLQEWLKDEILALHWYSFSLFSFRRSQSKDFYLLNCTLKQRNMNLQRGKHTSFPIFDWMYYCFSRSLHYIDSMFHALPRHVSEYLKVQQRDPKAHKFLGQLYEREGDIDKAVGCYKVGKTWHWKNRAFLLERMPGMLCSLKSEVSVL